MLSERLVRSLSKLQRKHQQRERFLESGPEDATQPQVREKRAMLGGRDRPDLERPESIAAPGECSKLYAVWSELELCHNRSDQRLL